METERRVNRDWPKDVPRYAWRRFEDQPREWQIQMTYLRGRAPCLVEVSIDGCETH